MKKPDGRAPSGSVCGPSAAGWGVMPTRSAAYHRLRASVRRSEHRGGPAQNKEHLPPPESSSGFNCCLKHRPRRSIAAQAYTRRSQQVHPKSIKGGCLSRLCIGIAVARESYRTDFTWDGLELPGGSIFLDLLSWITSSVTLSWRGVNTIRSLARGVAAMTILIESVARGRRSRSWQSLWRPPQSLAAEPVTV